VKEFLSSRGVAIQERNVSADREAAAEMIRISQQRGVPVVVLDGQVVVGFNRPQLERVLSGLGRPRLGAAVADAATMEERGLTGQPTGAYVGKVTPGGVADQSGLHAGDVIVSLGGRPVSSATHLQQLLAGLSRGQRVPVELVRDGQTVSLVLVFG
jgi:glutaredoxin